jgi:hypothetical protein
VKLHYEREGGLMLAVINGAKVEHKAGRGAGGLHGKASSHPVSG